MQVKGSSQVFGGSSEETQGGVLTEDHLLELGQDFGDVLEGFGDFTLVARGDHLDVVFEVDEEGEVEIVINEDSSTCWPVVVDSCRIVRRTSVDAYS